MSDSGTSPTSPSKGSPTGLEKVHIDRLVAELQTRDWWQWWTHARRLFEAAEAADQDAFLISFMQDRVGLDLSGAANILGEFREWRAKRDPEIDGAGDVG